MLCAYCAQSTSFLRNRKREVKISQPSKNSIRQLAEKCGRINWSNQMSEGLSQNSGPGSKNRLIEANVFFDAAEYVNLMRRVSPDSLIMDDEGNIDINVVDGRRIIDETIKKLDLSPDEVVIYMFALEDKIKELLRQ